MHIFDIIKEFFYKYKGCVCLYMLLLMSVPITTVLLPHYYGKLIEKIKDSNEVKRVFYIIVGLWCLAILLNYLSNYLDSYFKPLMQKYIRKNVINHILDKYKEAYKEQEVGNLISKIIKLPNTINDIFHEVKDYIMPIILMFTFAIGYFSYINPYIGLVTLIGVGIFFGIVYGFLKVCIKSANEADNYADEVHEQISEMFENMSNVYASDMCIGEMSRFKNFSDNLRGKYSNTIKCSANFNLLFSISYLVLFFTVCYMTYRMYASKKITLTNLISVIIISLYIISYLSEATVEIRDFIFNLGTLQKTQNYLDELQKIEIGLDKKDMKIEFGKIDVIGVTMVYPGESKPLFKDLSVSIQSGQSVAIMGRIGSGKSSFVKMLLKFYQIQEGKILIDGVDISGVSADSIRKQIMYIPQNPSIFNRTLFDNISYGLSVSKTQVDQLLRDIGAYQLFNNIRLDDNVGKKGERLSGGQKQLVYLIRAILKNSKILILDEPTSALDENSRNYILGILKTVIRGKTTLIITHDPTLLKYTDKVLMFDKGKLL